MDTISAGSARPVDMKEELNKAPGVDTLRSLRQRRETYMVIINYDARTETEENVRRLLRVYKARVRSKVVRGESAELTVEILMKDDNLSLTNTLAEIEGVGDVTLVQYRGSYEA